MIRITVCVGSSCYVRGSERLADELTQLVRERGLDAEVELTGAFCMEQCSMGVSVRIGDRLYCSVDAAQASAFFESELAPSLQGAIRR